MSQKANWNYWLTLIFNVFMGKNEPKSCYEVVDLYECKKTGFTKAVIKISKYRTIEENIKDIIVNNKFLDSLDKKTIRTLTHLATVEYLKPDCSIIAQKITEEIDSYILEIKSKHDCTVVKKSPLEISKDVKLIARFNPVDANRIGYMAGVLETAREYQTLRKQV